VRQQAPQRALQPAPLRVALRVALLVVQVVLLLRRRAAQVREVVW
jgi:hypothetical protein